MKIDTLVIGAGISGISAAWDLHKAGKEYLIAEEAAEVGGCIATVKKGECLWEEGPSSFMPKPEMLSLITEAKMTEDIITADRKLPRFIYHHKKLKPVPTSPLSLLTTNLLSLSAKLRLITGLCGFILPAPKHEESVKSFFTRHLGKQVTERLLEPFVSGVYAGNPAVLTSEAVFAKVGALAGKGKILPGILPGLIKKALFTPKKKTTKSSSKSAPLKKGMLCNLKNGLDSLPKNLAALMGTNLRSKWKAISITKVEEGYCTTFETPDGQHSVISAHIVLAVPAFVAADLLTDLHFKALADLREITYPAVASVVCSWDQIAAKKAPIGFGFLTPRSEGIRTLGTVFTSALFTKRCPGGHRLFTSFIGGATDPQLAALHPDEIGEIVKKDIARCTSISAEEGQVIASRLWKKAIPQYNMGHRGRISRIRTAQAQLPGIFLIGNYFDGVSLGDCISNARKTIRTLTDT